MGLVVYCLDRFLLNAQQAGSVSVLLPGRAGGSFTSAGLTPFPRVLFSRELPRWRRERGLPGGQAARGAGRQDSVLQASGPVQGTRSSLGHSADGRTARPGRQPHGPVSVRLSGGKARVLLERSPALLARTCSRGSCASSGSTHTRGHCAHARGRLGQAGSCRACSGLSSGSPACSAQSGGSGP